MRNKTALNKKGANLLNKIFLKKDNKSESHDEPSINMDGPKNCIEEIYDTSYMHFTY